MRPPLLRVLPLLAGLLPVALAAQGRPVRRPPVTPPKPAPAPAAALPALAIPLARVRGEVFDSVGLAPLADATVQFVETADPAKVRSIRTDSLGEFTLDSVRVGTYLVGVIHPQVDRLGLENRVVQVRVAASGDVTLPLGTPSPATLLAMACNDAGPGLARGAFMGLVRTARGTPLEGPARVRAQYNETTVTPAGVQRRFPARFADANSTGAFVVCGVPPDATITTRAYAGRDSSGVVELRVPYHGLLVRDLIISSPQRVTDAGGADARGRTVLRGTGRVKGTVRDAGGKPLAGARVSLPGSAAETATASGGQFSLGGLPGGSWMLEARAVGFEPQRVAVDILDSAETVAEVAMTGLTPTVDTVRVRADRWTQEMAGFESRRKMGGGYFLDDAALSRRNAQFSADILRGVPGVTITPGGAGRDRVTMRGSAGAGTCVPEVFVNGMRTPVPDGIVDNLVQPQDIRAVEVYSRLGSMPIEYQSRNGCGSIVIWTGARRPPP
ncbi:MAG: carboxypeptidase regulatory-like domain-containing protein [Gemmatimonas sp.]|jgi:hypothetical protein|uniref:carboxypeptidase-like regulatory domain-containing protein n=1 Tax=Gemmatimonas sp. TaxID=1962908 RepID=UPI00391EE993|nr:Plug and carboxypeptidase regulatory-like domain-containing protein [Gemmatimonadota bacterium]